MSSISTTPARETEAEKAKLSDLEYRLLKRCCNCEDGKGVPIGREWRRVANSLTRKGLAWTMTSVFMVCMATDKGRAIMNTKATGAQS